MFEGLTERLSGVFDQLTKRGTLSEADVTGALREVRVALLEADVALPVVKDFIDSVRERALGEEVVRAVKPGQMVIKIVQDHLTEMLGPEAVDINLKAAAPVPIMLVGLQGSGKTTTAAKIGKRLTEKDHKKVLMASLDVNRPAAQQQLEILGQQIQVATLPIMPGQKPVEIAKRAIQTAKLEAYDVVILDTAGRLSIDDELMDEAEAVRDAVSPAETMLVADAMTGQDAVNVAQAFNEKLGLTGIALTRVDGDARGGAALSMKAITGCPIKLIGEGEKLDALDVFQPERIASRILGMGDIVGLVEKATELVEEEEAAKLAARLEKGQFNFDDMAKQLGQLRKMGGLEGVMSMLPGVAKAKAQMADAKIDERALLRQEAIISSMTPTERAKPQIIKASRRRRIAAGSGTSVQDVNKLFKQYQQMSQMVKKAKKLGKKGLARHGMQGLMPNSTGSNPFN